MEGERREDQMLVQMSFRRGRKEPHEVKVRIYPAPEDASDPRRYIARDINGNDIELNLGEQAQIEQLIFGKVSAHILHRLSKQRFIAQKAGRRFPKKGLR